MALSTNGLSEVCMMALPMPKSEKDSNNIGKSTVNIGTSIAASVITRLSRTVFFLPILFISRLVGILKIRNQKNTSEGSVFAIASESAKSSFT